MANLMYVLKEPRYSGFYNSVTDTFSLANVEQNQTPAFANGLQEPHSIYRRLIKRTGM
jgi:hypothetical protein